MVEIPSKNIWMIPWLIAARTLLNYVQPSYELLGKDHRLISRTPEGLPEGNLTQEPFFVASAKIMDKGATTR